MSFVLLLVLSLSLVLGINSYPSQNTFLYQPNPYYYKLATRNPRQNGGIQNGVHHTQILHIPLRQTHNHMSKAATYNYAQRQSMQYQPRNKYEEVESQQRISYSNQKYYRNLGQRRQPQSNNFLQQQLQRKQVSKPTPIRTYRAPNNHIKYVNKLSYPQLLSKTNFITRQNIQSNHILKQSHKPAPVAKQRFQCNKILENSCPKGYRCMLRSGGTIGNCMPITIPIAECGKMIDRKCAPGYSCKLEIGSSVGKCTRISAKAAEQCGGVARYSCKPGFECRFQKKNPIGRCFRIATNIVDLSRMQSNFQGSSHINNITPTVFEKIGTAIQPAIKDHIRKIDPIANHQHSFWHSHPHLSEDKLNKHIINLHKGEESIKGPNTETQSSSINSNDPLLGKHQHNFSHNHAPARNENYIEPNLINMHLIGASTMGANINTFDAEAIPQVHNELEVDVQKNLNQEGKTTDSTPSIEKEINILPAPSIPNIQELKSKTNMHQNGQSGFHIMNQARPLRGSRGYTMHSTDQEHSDPNSRNDKGARHWESIISMHNPHAHGTGHVWNGVNSNVRQPQSINTHIDLLPEDLQISGSASENTWNGESLEQKHGFHQMVPYKNTTNCDGVPNYQIDNEDFLVTAVKEGCPTMSWNEAVDFCQSKSMEIVSLGKSITNEKAQKILDIARLHQDAGFWTGGYIAHPENKRVADTIKWTSNLEDVESVQQGKGYFSKMSRLASSPGQPDNYEYIWNIERGVSEKTAMKEHCVAMLYDHIGNDGAKLHDLACYHQLYAVCHKKKMPQAWGLDINI